MVAGSNSSFFSTKAKLHLQKLLKSVVHMGSMKKFERDTGEFQGALGSLAPASFRALFSGHGELTNQCKV